MVPDIEEFRACQEALVEEGGQGCLDIEWVSSGQSDQSRVSGNVSIGGLFVDVEDLGGCIGGRWQGNFNLLAQIGAVLFCLRRRRR